MRVRQAVCLGSMAFLAACGPLDGAPVAPAEAVHASGLDGCPDFREATHLRDSRWLLWDPWMAYRSPAVAVIDIATHEGVCHPNALDGIQDVQSIAGRITASGAVELTVLVSRPGRDMLVRGSLDEPAAEWPVLRTWTDDEYASTVGDRLFRDGNDLLVVERENRDAPWSLRDALTGAWLAGPFEGGQPTAISREGGGSWLVSDLERVWSWPHGDLRFWNSEEAIPVDFVGVPPMPPGWHVGDHAVVLDDGSVLASDNKTLFHWSNEGVFSPVLTGDGFRFPVDGEGLTAATNLLGSLELVDGRPYVWNLELQQLLEVAPDGRSDVRNVWMTKPSAPPPDLHDVEDALLASGGIRFPELRRILANLDAIDDMPRDYVLPLALDAITSDPRFGGDEWHSWERAVVAWSIAARLGVTLDPAVADASPASAGDVLRAWREHPISADEGPSLARFAVDHAAEMELLAGERDLVIPQLLADGSPAAISALALLRAREAEPKFRELLASEELAPQCGRFYYEADLGLDALEHLYGKTLDEIDPLSPGEEQRLREIEIADDADEGYDWGYSHAGFLLSAHGREVPQAPRPEGEEPGLGADYE